MPAGARLSPDARRAQLVALGVELLATRPLDRVSLEDVATAAGISRALPFHYFPTRHDFLVAIVEAAGDQLLAETSPTDDLAPLDRLRKGLEGYLGYVEANPATYLALVRGAAGADQALADVVERTRATIAARITDGIGALTGAARPDPLLRLAVRGWVGMVEEVTVTWLQTRRPKRADVLWLLEESLVRLLALTDERGNRRHP